MTVPTLLVTGPGGVGKTSVASEALDVLEERNLSWAFFDLDGLTYFHPRPPGDRYGERFALASLGLLFPRMREYGVVRLVLARVIEKREQLELYRKAVPDAEITVVRLTAPLGVIHDRLRRREVGAGLDWHLARARSWTSTGAAHPVGDPARRDGGKNGSRARRRDPRHARLDVEATPRLRTAARSGRGPSAPSPARRR